MSRVDHMIIRKEKRGDEAAIADVTARAFLGAEHSDGSEPAIIARLRASCMLAVSLVAVEDDSIVGHIAFSQVTIDGHSCNWFGLGPVSVVPSHQNRKIGTALILCGLDALRAEGAKGCVVLGAPDYYRRFGFVSDARLRYEGAPAEYFMRMSLSEDETPAGKVEYAKAFAGA